MFERRQKPFTKLIYSSGKLILFLLLLLLALIWSKKNLMGLNVQIYDRIYQPTEQQPLRLGHDHDKRQFVRAESQIYHEYYPEVLAMRLDSDALNRTVMSEGDYTPQDIAVYLKHLREKKLQAFALSSPLQWELPADDMGLQSLVLSLKRQHHYVLGIRAQTAAMADFTPDALASTVIPLDHVKGDISALPSANRCMPNALQDCSDGLNWAVDSIVGERHMENPSMGSKMSYPLLVRWNGEIYPTLPLKLAMDVLGIKVNDIRVILGQHLLLGERQLALDDAGRSPLEGVSHREIPLEQFVDGGEDAQLEGKVMIIEHQPAGSRSNQSRLGNLADTLSLLLAIQESETVETQELELGLVLKSASWSAHKTLYIIIFSLLFLWVLIMPLFNRSLLYLLYLILIPAISAVLFYWSMTQGIWLNWACIVSVSLVLLLFSPLRWKKIKRRH